MRTKICKHCGCEFETESGHPDSYVCPECRKQIQHDVAYRERVCKDCGATFMGYPHSLRCPTCREKAKRERERTYKKNGAKRPLGSTDYCAECGKPYVVESGNQKYCPECAKIMVPANIKSHKKEYIAEHQDELAQHKAEMRDSEYICVICGKKFKKSSPTVTCSPECAKELARRQQAQADLNRGHRSLPVDEKYDSGLPKSGVVGVTYRRSSGRWQASYKKKYIGVYSSVDEAAQAIEDYKMGL